MSARLLYPAILLAWLLWWIFAIHVHDHFRWSRERKANRALRRIWGQGITREGPLGLYDPERAPGA